MMIVLSPALIEPKLLDETKAITLRHTDDYYAGDITAKQIDIAALEIE